MSSPVSSHGCARRARANPDYFSQKLKTRVIKKSTNPEWNEELTLSIEDPADPVRLVSIPFHPINFIFPLFKLCCICFLPPLLLPVSPFCALLLPSLKNIQKHELLSCPGDGLETGCLVYVFSLRCPYDEWGL